MSDLSALHIQYANYPEQGTTAIYEYTQNLAKLGYDVSVIVAGREEDPTYEEINGVKVYRIFPRNKAQRDLRSLFTFTTNAGRCVNRIVKEEKIDIIHLYYTMGASLIYEMLSDKRIKTILDIRSAPITLRYLSGFAGRMYAKFRKCLLESEVKNFDIITVPEIKIGMNLFDYKKRIFELPLGANFNIFHPGTDKGVRSKYGLEGKKVVIYVGAVYPQRRLENLLTGFKRVVKDCNTARLLIVGGGPDLKRLSGMAERLNIDDNVIFTGYVPYYDVPNFMRASDVAVSFVPITAEYNYQPPVKTMEYLASGLPTVATSTYSHRKIIKDKKNGVLVNDDAESVYQGLSQLIEDSSLSNKIRERSRNSVKNYDWSEIVKRRLIPAYEALEQF